MEDAALEGAEVDDLRARFKSLVDAGKISDGIRDDYFVSVDANFLRGFGGSSPIIPVWEVHFDPNDPEIFDYPGGLAVLCSDLLPVVYPTMLMEKSTTLRTMHLIASG